MRAQPSQRMSGIKNAFPRERPRSRLDSLCSNRKHMCCPLVDVPPLFKKHQRAPLKATANNPRHQDKLVILAGSRKECHNTCRLLAGKLTPGADTLCTPPGYEHPRRCLLAVNNVCAQMSLRAHATATAFWRYTMLAGKANGVASQY